MALGQRGQPGAGKHKFCKPTQVAVGRDGAIFVSGAACALPTPCLRSVWYAPGQRLAAQRNAETSGMLMGRSPHSLHPLPTPACTPCRRLLQQPGGRVQA